MDQFAGIVLVAVAASLLIAMATGGPAGARNWLRAKFLGRVA
ncbi:hypothetical protein [Conexibacter sp. W3-3-2]|nr:hypothetical protein [Conexibacter sp. W3-3-2]